jgi:FkbH-like protein
LRGAQLTAQGDKILAGVLDQGVSPPEIPIETLATEEVRLVIWDLDDTFWRGTLTEGGIIYQSSHHDVVIELARRGIMSSICSKNDLVGVRQILIENGIWDYFVFPSVNWEPKGQRVQKIIETMKLRPASVLFIDDNPSNLNEARHYIADLQIASEAVVPAILDNPLFRGKSDSSLTRLGQYKLLETRTADELQHGGDNIGFLRRSNIRVEFIYEIEEHIDRAIELVNRTNQLNFTKMRLPEDCKPARQALLARIKPHYIQAGLIRVFDDYGDYGICGYYAMATTTDQRPRLIDYCFSCRILNMGVENWLFDRLGKPEISVVGDVLTDLHRPIFHVDWITEAGRAAVCLPRDKADNTRRFVHLVARGGCDLDAILHYISVLAESIDARLGTVRNGIAVRPDHSEIILFCKGRATLDKTGALARFFFEARDLSDLPAEGSRFFLLSFWADAKVPVYRHKESGVDLPFHVHEFMSTNLTGVDREAFYNKVSSDDYRNAFEIIRNEYEWIGLVTEVKFKWNLRLIFNALEDGDTAFVVMLNSRLHRQEQGTSIDERILKINEWTRSVKANYENVILVDIRDFVYSEEEVHAMNHFDRMVYHRLSRSILDQVGLLTE